jgi:hypothetical protein
MKKELQKTSAIAALAVGLIFGCTPREQVEVKSDSIAMTNTNIAPAPATETSGVAEVIDSIQPKKYPQAPKPGTQPATPNSPNDKNSGDKMMRKSITAVLESNTHLWMEIPGVNGTGEGQDPNGNPAIIIFTDRDAADIQSKLPSEKDGYPIIIREIGVVKPMKLESN